MDPVSGRFMSVDPIYQAPTNSQSVNPYSYVMNNPLSLVDPSGYCASATDNENDANPTVCGTGNNDAGASDYKGRNNGTSGNTGSHVDGHSDWFCSNCESAVWSASSLLGSGMDKSGSTDPSAAQHKQGGAADTGSPNRRIKKLSDIDDHLNVSWTDASNSHVQSAELDGVDVAFGNRYFSERGYSFWTQNRNPSSQEYNAELDMLAQKTGIPRRALNALYATESHRTQFAGRSPLMSNTGAVGVSQILLHTALSYGIDFGRIGTDWRYNMEAGAVIYKAGYNHRWNDFSPNDRFHAIRGYDFYHDNWEDVYPRFGITGSTYERSYMKHYDNDN